MKKIVVSSIVALFSLSCSLSAPNNSTQVASSSLSGRMPHRDFRWSQYAPTAHSSLVRDTSSSSPQTPLLGGAGVGSLHPSLIKYNFAELEKEYKSFSTKALSDAYVKRMFGKYLAPVNTTQLTRQLEFSRYLKGSGDTSYETSLKTMFSQTPALYNQMTGIGTISDKMTSESGTFGTFVNGLSPYPGVPVAVSATNITSTSFTAHWNAVSGATGYKLFVDETEVYSGSSTSFSVTGLTGGTNHSYYVKAFNNAGNSSGSNTINLTLLSEILNEGKIVFTSNKDNTYGEIYTMNADGSNQTRLTTNSYYDKNPAWSPDRTKIVFESGDKIYVMNADGSAQTKITNNSSYYDSDPNWSPDGTKIVFTSYRNSNMDIYVMNVDGSNQTRITTNGANDAYSGWSPDGTKITFMSGKDSLYGEIYTMNTDGSNQTRLTNNGNNEYYPSWSPDGSKIAFMSNRNGNNEIYTMNTDGSNPIRLTTNSYDDSNPSWSTDGTKITFLSNNKIYVMNSDGSNQINITNDSYIYNYPSWSNR